MLCIHVKPEALREIMPLCNQWFLIISDHWETKDTGNQATNSEICSIR